MIKLLSFLVIATVCHCQSTRPNFVIIYTDDQDQVMGGMDPMANVRSLITEQGVTFNKSYTTSPICCPSRSSFLTGLYVHNHEARNNSISGGCYGTAWRERHEHNTLATALREAGYNTFYSGKYMNGYGTGEVSGPEVVPPGWTDWHTITGNSRYYDYTMSNNGVATFSDDLYLTDVIRNFSLAFLEEQSQSTPFFMMLAPPAPHAPFTPAPRHEGAFASVTTVKLPNFNLAVKDKHWLMRMPPSPLPEDLMTELDRVYRSRWETLLAVDEMVADVMSSLKTKELLDNTYVIYTSDNGYHVGQFSQVYDKRQPYESDIKVPLVIRGPGVEKNVIRNQPVLNIDIAPTLMNLAGLKPPSHIDGHIINLFSEEDAVTERNMLIEFYGEGNDDRVDSTCPWKYDSVNLSECYPDYDCKCQDSRNNTYGCVRHIAERIDFKYCAFDDEEQFVEVYNLADDPYELTNVESEVLPAVKNWYQSILSQLLRCKGAKQCDNPVAEFE